MGGFQGDYRKGVNEVTGEVGWTLAKVFTRVIIPIIVLGLIIGGISWVIRVASQPAKVIEKTMDADNILYNYEWFKQTHQDFKAINGKIENSKEALDQFVATAGLRENWSFEDKNEYSRLNTIVLGLKNQRQDIVATYNARSKMANRAIFKRGVPETLE